MPTLITRPVTVAAAGNKPKTIEEFIGRASSGHDNISVARMVSPGGWIEPPQQPDFHEITLVLRGSLQVESADGVVEVRAGQAIITQAGERVRYSTPHQGGAEYISICLPAFSPRTVHRLSEATTKNTA